MNETTTAAPGLLTEVLGNLAYALSEAQPYLPMYLHLIISALFPIFTGAHASLVRPSSAAKPRKKEKKEHAQDEEDSDDDDDESSIQKMEGLSPSDAIVFPVLAGSTLAGLYFLIKWMGAALLNKILGWYFSSIAVFSVAKLLSDGFAVIESFVWPDLYADERVIWRVQSSHMQAVEVSERADATTCSRNSPLPGILGRIKLPAPAVRALWILRDLPGTRLSVRAHVARLVSFKIRLTLRTIFSAILALTLIIISNFFSKAWWLTNLQGFAFSYSALQLMSPTTFTTGSMILVALFFYDIYFVFFTPMMVTVATNLDVPIKLLFPRPAEEGETIRKLAMLGLGDIVLPGIMIGLALRFDLYMHYLNKQTSVSHPQTSDTDQPSKSATTTEVHKEKYSQVTGHWGNKFWTTSWTGRSLLFVTPPKSLQPASPELRRSLIPSFSKPYFYASIVGYIAGMCATLAVMQIFHHAQPALLYLVPGVLSSLWLTGLARGELKQMWEFTEASEEENDDKKSDESKAYDNQKDAGKEDESSWWSRSFFSSTTQGRNAKHIEKSIAKNVSQNEKEEAKNPTSQSSSSGKEKSTADKEKKKETPREMILFSITREPPRWAKSAHASARGSQNFETGEKPRWRGARSSEEHKDERPEKRLRTS